MGFSSQTLSTQSENSYGSGTTKMSHLEIEELLAAEHEKKSSPCTADMFYAIMNGETTGEEKAVSAAYALMNGESLADSNADAPQMELSEDVFDLTPLSLYSQEARSSARDSISVVSDMSDDSGERRNTRRSRRGSTGRPRRRGSVGSNNSGGSLLSPTGRVSSDLPSDRAKRLIEVVQDSFRDFSPEEGFMGTPSPIPRHSGSRSRAGSVKSGVSVASETSTQFREAFDEDGNEKGVRFGSVRVRYYERIIDINPGCSSGVALGIGWKYNKSRRLKLDEYELQRGGVNYKAQQLVLPRHIREDIAKQFGYSQKDIADGTRLNLRYKNERKQTIDNLNLSGMEEKLESATRKVMKVITFGTKRRM